MGHQLQKKMNSHETNAFIGASFLSEMTHQIEKSFCLGRKAFHNLTLCVYFLSFYQAQRFILFLIVNN